jgi:hypothetical protein
MTHTRAITLTDAGPHAGWDLHVSHAPHDLDHMQDRYSLSLWPPGAKAPAHQFDTYRHGYGWTILNAALTASDQHVDTLMQTAAHWWTQNQTSLPYHIHRILHAIDDTTWATRDEIAQRLNLAPADLEPHTPHADRLDAAARHGLITWRNLRGEHPYAALTPAGYDLIHPEDQPSADRRHSNLAAALEAEQAPAITASPAAGRAFRTIGSVSAHPVPDSANAAAPPTRHARAIR